MIFPLKLLEPCWWISQWLTPAALMGKSRKKTIFKIMARRINVSIHNVSLPIAMSVWLRKKYWPNKMIRFENPKRMISRVFRIKCRSSTCQFRKKSSRRTYIICYLEGILIADFFSSPIWNIDSISRWQRDDLTIIFHLWRLYKVVYTNDVKA